MPLADSFARKTDRLLERIRAMGPVAVAFSGGVDSSVVAKAAHLACGERAIALTAVSPSLAESEKQIAVDVAVQIGIRHELVETREFLNSDYRKNASDRCFFCKDELYTVLEQLQQRYGFAAILNGANADDRGDHRPGMQAATEHNVVSPLLDCGFSKQDVRDLARDWNLPVWNKPASPCLSSRIAYGLEVTPTRVQRVEQAEAFLRELLDCDELRVRHEQNDLARIEVPLAALTRLTEPAARAQVIQRLCELGFRFITLDLEGFRSGSLNASIAPEELRIL